MIEELIKYEWNKWSVFFNALGNLFYPSRNTLSYSFKKLLLQLSASEDVFRFYLPVSDELKHLLQN